MTELEIKEQMCEVGRRVYNKGMVAATNCFLSPLLLSFR